jgi:Asp-tRNA(Asn)/Glu-tRNA(Gln) amidotransferase B subunit
MAALLSLSLNSSSRQIQEFAPPLKGVISHTSLRIDEVFNQVYFPQIQLDAPFKETISTRSFLIELVQTLKDFTNGNKTTEAILIGMTNRSIQNIIAAIEKQEANALQKALMLEGSIHEIIESYKEGEVFDYKEFMQESFFEIVDDVMETTTAE